MLDISLKTIPHDKQRYNTCGDYYRDKHRMNIRVSECGSKDHEFLVALHEMIEFYLVEKRKISIDKIDKFDMEYEKNRKEGDYSEPGDDKTAPYYDCHQFATGIERLMAHELRVDWLDYENIINNL